MGVGGRRVDCGFGDIRDWTCSHSGKATLRCVPQFEKKILSANSLHDVCWRFRVQSNRAGSEYSQAKMAPSSITHYKPHDSFHCAILNLTRLR